MKTTFFIVLSVICIFFSVSSIAGGKCKYDYDKKDVFSGKRVCYKSFTLFKKNVQFGNPTGLFRYEFKIGKNGNDYFLEINLNICGIIRTIVGSTDTTFIKLDNGNLIKIVPKGEYRPVAKLDGIMEYSNYIISFTLDPSDFIKLSESKIFGIKSMIGPSENIVSPKESNSLDILEIINCLKAEK